MAIILLVLGGIIFSVSKESISEIEIKKSRFICYLKNVSTEEEAKAYVKSIVEMHPNAAHHCYAYKVGVIDRVNDDGEPSGTAGMPMLNVLNHNQIVNTIAIVVRYFGGIKLGAGGLVRAYTDAVVVALDKGDINQLVPGIHFEVSGSYSDIDKINHILKTNNIVDYQVRYETNVIFELIIPVADYSNITEQLLNFNHLLKVKEIARLNITVSQD